jgi:hypothetical protein
VPTPVRREVDTGTAALAFLPTAGPREPGYITIACDPGLTISGAGGSELVRRLANKTVQEAHGQALEVTRVSNRNGTIVAKAAYESVGVSEAGREEARVTLVTWLVDEAGAWKITASGPRDRWAYLQGAYQHLTSTFDPSSAFRERSGDKIVSREP